MRGRLRGEGLLYVHVPTGYSTYMYLHESVCRTVSMRYSPCIIIHLFILKSCQLSRLESSKRIRRPTFCGNSRGSLLKLGSIFCGIFSIHVSEYFFGLFVACCFPTIEARYQFTQPTVVDTYYLQGGKSATGTTEVDWILQGHSELQ